ncbi:GIY-YIG nuclease family protein [Cytophaga sp. FL35]|uniref:GIY-YIG nuclease family protein n=1 Tax=Cytophaga sp. FL35 TaxID=1904456 RepID=UPI001653E5E0|nr:GIY-YIG nuclease family protein [Cytophaga sp. FL35]
MHYVYVIQSEKTKGFYIGETANLETRLNWHNNVELNIGVTKNSIPWQYHFTLPVPNRTIALGIEKHIKKMKSRVYLENLLKYPEISKRLLKKYS